MQIQDRVAHELSWSVQRDVTAPSGRDQGNSGLRKRGFGSEQMLGRRAASEGDRRLVLDEQHRVRDASGFARLLQLVLQSMHRLVRCTPEPEGC